MCSHNGIGNGMGVYNAIEARMGIWKFGERSMPLCDKMEGIAGGESVQSQQDEWG